MKELVGVSIGLSAPAKQEAPTLIYPSIPIGIQRMCFFVNRTSSWEYTGIDSLEGVVIGIAHDTSIEELNQYAKQFPNNFQYQPYHERFISQNVKKLQKNRIDTFISTRNSTLYTLKKLDAIEDVKIAGCVSSAPVYIAFTPSKLMGSLISELVNHFDQGMSRLIKQGYVDTILQKYDVGFSSEDLLKYNQ
ncbi:ABC transporter substrate-binding protein [Alteromonas sediminis]|uniref:ABC transporter substrate-binding protein n=1 Tax=Alteromonas sediminis TaxID=2259342 RepID=A0A3N5XWA4_9ALTE|nr:ABC transporter substrate-binding protein [Alteromonas sediminis]RPJ65087.1 ABC transporter substrate-binding protein [Alteromonas sediminis]